MNRVRRIALLVIGVLLIINGLLNIWDDARVLTYDITSILAGIGFVIARLSGTNKPLTSHRRRIVTCAESGAAS